MLTPDGLAAVEAVRREFRDLLLAALKDGLRFDVKKRREWYDESESVQIDVTFADEPVTTIYL